MMRIVKIYVCAAVVSLLTGTTEAKLPQVRTTWRGVLEPMRYGTVGECDLKAGLFTFPMVVDADGDGDLDLVVNSGGLPRHHFYHFFENPSPKGSRLLHPVFKAPRPIARGGYVSQQLPDGRTAVLGCRDYTFDYPSMKPYVKFKGLPDNVHSNNVRGNVWRFADLDGDARQDLVVAVGDWKEYGWDDAWDEAGEWKRGPLHGLFYFIRNEAAASGEERWGKPEILRLANGRPVEVFGNPSPLFEDWDGDGDLDLISVDFVDGITFFENIGTTTGPKFAVGRAIVDKFLKPIKADLCMVTATAADWDGDGRPDLFIDEEDGRVALVRNSGWKNAGTLVFETPYYFRAERDLLHFGILNTPFAVDIDDDGDQDLVCGNSAGYVAIVENVAGPKAPPRWNEPKVIEVDGAPLRLMAGYNGSIQGPCERKWGYTCLSVADWDGDGVLDIMLNSTRGEIVWCRNVGTRRKPEFAHPEPVPVAWEGPQPEMKYGWLKPHGSKNLLTQWRTTPYMVDWNGDGLVDLVAIDPDGCLAWYERAERGGRLVLLPPKRVFVDEHGEALGFGGWDGKGKGRGGNTGRRKFCLVDWDGDGRLDIIANSNSVCLYRQLKAENGKWFFRREGDLVEERMAGHSTCPTACDFDGNGVPDLVIGAEDGYFYFLRNPRTDELPITNVMRTFEADFTGENPPERLCVDFSLPLDLSRAKAVAFDFSCEDLQTFSSFTFYLRSGDGWYDARVSPHVEGRTEHILIPLERFSTEGKPAGFDKVSAVRFSAWKGGPGKCRIGFGKLRVVDKDEPESLVVRVDTPEHMREMAARIAKMPTRAGERRLAWCHSPWGLGPKHDWNSSARFLRENGFTDVIANLAWGGSASYESKVLAKAVSSEGKPDALKACMSACRRHGIRLHVWKVCWNLWSNCLPKDLRLRYQAEGRLQLNKNVREGEDWLCPSDPRNREQEIEAMCELGDLGVDGVHFDYIRYPGSGSCFCEGCRRRFEERLGQAVADWPKDVLSGGSLAAQWVEFRADCISAVVEGVSKRLRAVHPKTEISAAVMRDAVQDRVTLGQDWGRWCRERWLDFVCPMDYTEAPAIFRGHLRRQKSQVVNVKFYPGIGLSCWQDDGGDADRFADQLEALRREGVAGFAVFNLDRRAERLFPLLGKGPFADVLKK